MKTKILAGVTNDNELYFVEIEKQTKDHNYFAMSGFTVRPIELENAKDQSRESLQSLIDDEISMSELPAWYFKDSDDLVDYVIDNDGNLSGIDTSLYPGSVEVDGVEYVFESGSAGQHVEKELKEYFIDKTDYNILMSVWEKYHLKSDVKMSPVENMTVDAMFDLGYFKDKKTQDQEALIIKAIKKMYV